MELADKKKEIEAAYSAVAGPYADQLFHELDHKPIDRVLLSHLAAETQGKGLLCDIGCGPGEIAAYLHALGAPVAGIDISPEMIALARQLSPGIDFRVGDMFQLDLPDACLAGITAFYAIVNFDEAELPLIFKELHRVLQLDGLLLLAFHIGNEKIMAEDFLGQGVRLGFTLFDPDEVIDMLKAQGFTIQSALIRYPHENVESQTRRAYLFARKTQRTG